METSDTVSTADVASSRPARPLWARALALITSPRSVFEELAARPAWFWTATTLCIFAAIVGFGIWDSVIAPYAVDQAESRGDLTSEQLARVEQMYMSPNMKIVAALTGAVFQFGIIVLLGLALFGLTSFLMGGRATVKQALSVISHAMLVHIPRAAVAVPLAMSRQDPSVTIGPGALMPVTEATGFMGKALAMFLGYFDLFNLWALGLCILGMSVVSRLPTRQVAVALIAAFLGMAVLFSCLGAVFQR